MTEPRKVGRRLPSNRALHKRLLAEMRHKQECNNDPFAKDVCEGIYGDRVDSNLGLVEALRAVYALVGQDKQVRKIIEDAIEEHGI